MDGKLKENLQKREEQNYFTGLAETKCKIDASVK